MPTPEITSLLDQIGGIAEMERMARRDREIGPLPLRTRLVLLLIAPAEAESPAPAIGRLRGRRSRVARAVWPPAGRVLGEQVVSRWRCGRDRRPGDGK